MQRIGLIIPSSNIVVEDTLRRLTGRIDSKIAFHIARLSVVTVSLGADSLDQFKNVPLDRAVDQLCEAEVDRIVFAGTAGAWLGIDDERTWCAETARRVDVDVTSTTLLALEALRATASANAALVTPFTGKVHERILENFAEEGISIDFGKFLGLELSREMAEVPPETIASLMRDCLEAECDTVLCFCTNFRGSEACAQIPANEHSARLLDSVDLTLSAVSDAHGMPA